MEGHRFPNNNTQGGISELNLLIKDELQMAGLASQRSGYTSIPAGAGASVGAGGRPFPESSTCGDYDLQHVVAMATTQPEQSFGNPNEALPLTPAILSQWLERPQQWRFSPSRSSPGMVAVSAGGGRTSLTAEELDSLKIQNSPTPCLRQHVKLEAGRPNLFVEMPAPTLGPVLSYPPVNIRRSSQVRKKIDVASRVELESIASRLTFF